MSYSSPLVILPKFLWKHIAIYSHLQDIAKIRVLTSFRTIFDDAYCKQSLLGDKTKSIIAVRTNNIQAQSGLIPTNSSYWDYALIHYYEFDCIGDLFEFIKQKEFRKFANINVFIKTGNYDIKQNTSGTKNMYNKYNLYGKNCSISITGSTIGQTIISSSGILSWHLRIPFKISFENIIFDASCTFSAIKTTDTSLKIKYCTFNEIISLDTIKDAIISHCIFNTESTIYINTTSIDYNNNNNNIQQKYIFLIKNVENNTIIIRDNTISNGDSLIGFFQHSSKTGVTKVIVKNNHLTNILKKYNRIGFFTMDAIHASKNYQKKIRSKCIIEIDGSNILTNCGFTIDTKN